jgi:predicted PurR-regulated permease PerM
MNLDKNNMKKIIGLIVLAVFLFAVSQNLASIVGLIGFLFDVLMPFILGLCIAFILNVLMKVIEEKLFAVLNKKDSKIWNKLRRPASLILTCLFVVGIFAFLMLLLVPEIKKTVEIISENLPKYFESAKSLVLNFADKYNISLGKLRNTHFNWDKIQDLASGFIKRSGSSLFIQTINVTSSIFSGIFKFVLGVVFSLYVLLQKETLGRQAQNFLYAFVPKPRSDKIVEVCKLSYHIFSNFVSGQCLEALTFGVLCFIGMFLLHLPYALLISTLVGITALIPIFGAFIGTGIGAVLILTVSPIKALWFIIFILILQQFDDNLIYPKIVGKSVDLPGIWVMMALTVGGGLYGVTGMLLSVPISSVIYSLLRSSIRKRLEVKGEKDEIPDS